MPKGKRVEWSEFEQDTLYSAVVAVLKRDPRLTLIKAMQASQIALQDEKRRRNINAIANFPAPLRNRFITAGLLSKDWEKTRRRRETTPSGPDPKDQRIEELEAEVNRLAEELRAARIQVAQLEAEPGAMETIQNFIAETAALAMQKLRAVPGGAPMSFTPNAAVRPPKHDPKPRTGSDTRPPILLLVGLGREEIAPYERKFNGRAYFRYWSDGKLHTLAEILRRAEFTFIRNEPPLSQPTLDTIRGITDKFQNVVAVPHRMEEEIENYLARRARAQ